MRNEDAGAAFAAAGVWGWGRDGGSCLTLRARDSSFVFQAPTMVAKKGDTN